MPPPQEWGPPMNVVKPVQKRLLTGLCFPRHCNMPSGAVPSARGRLKPLDPLQSATSARNEIAHCMGGSGKGSKGRGFSRNLEPAHSLLGTGLVFRKMKKETEHLPSPVTVARNHASRKGRESTVKSRAFNPKAIYHLLVDTVLLSSSGDTLSQGAALSYYTFFAIAPLFVIVLGVAGYWFGEAAAQRELFGQLNQLVGKEGGEAIQTLVVAAGKSRTGFLATCILAGGTLAVAATSVFVQLQTALNALWQVKHTQGRGLRNFIRHRLLSFAMVLGISFLLLVSLICSAGLAALGNFWAIINVWALGLRIILLKALNFTISLGIITILFTMIFKFLPDMKVGWRDVWLGGFITALLFDLGKLIIGVYIGRSSLSSVYGAVGSLAIVLVWVYYSAQILLFGAQFTCLYARRFGVKPEPVNGAEFVSVKTPVLAKSVHGT